MKVLVLCALYEPLGIGGAERVARTLATSMRDEGHEVVVLTTAGRRHADRVVDGIRVRSLSLRNVYPLEGPRHSPLKPLWHAIDSYNFAMRSGVSRVLAEERPDLMHSHLLTGFSASAWSAARAAGIPVVHTLHDHYTICSRSTMTTGANPCGHWHLRCRALSLPRRRESGRVAHVVGVSKYILHRHQEYGAFPDVPASVIPNPCHLVGSPARTPAEVPETRLGFLGRLDRIKGIELLLASVQGLDGNWRLFIAGEGSDDAYVRRVRARYPDPRVVFVGRMDPRDFLDTLDLLIVPSLFPETFGLSAAEALAVGCPVLVSDRGALPELVVPGRNGFIFHADDPADLRRALFELVPRPDSLRALAEDCRRSAEPFAPRRVAAMYSDVYRSVID